MGDPVSLGIMAGSQLLGGAIKGAQAQGPSGMLQLQPNKWANYYQDLYPGMLSNSLNALGDSSGSALMMGNPEYRGMFHSANPRGGGGFTSERSPSGYAAQPKPLDMSGGTSSIMSAVKPTMDSMISKISNSILNARPNPMNKTMGVQAPNQMGNPNVMKTRRV